MSLNVNVGNVSKEMDKGWVLVNGISREIDKMYCNVGGLAKEGYSGVIPIYTPGIIDNTVCAGYYHGSGPGGYTNFNKESTHIYMAAKASRWKEDGYYEYDNFRISIESNLLDFGCISTLYIDTEFDTRPGLIDFIIDDTIDFSPYDKDFMKRYAREGPYSRHIMKLDVSNLSGFKKFGIVVDSGSGLTMITIYKIWGE